MIVDGAEEGKQAELRRDLTTSGGRGQDLKGRKRSGRDCCASPGTASPTIGIEGIEDEEEEDDWKAGGLGLKGRC